MAVALAESMSALTLKEEAAESPESLVSVRFKVSGLGVFDVELDPTAAVRDVKKLVKECCEIEPEHMRLIYEGRVLKESDTLECYKAGGDAPVQLMFTAGHTAMLGGSR